MSSPTENQSRNASADSAPDVVLRFPVWVRVAGVASYSVFATLVLYALPETGGGLRIASVAVLFLASVGVWHTCALRFIFGRDAIVVESRPFYTVSQPYAAVRNVGITTSGDVNIYFKDYGHGLWSRAARVWDRMVSGVWFSKDVFWIPAAMSKAEVVVEALRSRATLARVDGGRGDARQ